MIQQFHSWVYIHKKQKHQKKKNTCISIVTAALFTIAKTRKQPKHPLTNEWMKKKWYIYTIEY